MTRIPNHVIFSIVLSLTVANVLACSCMQIKKVSAEALMSDGFVFDQIVFKGKLINLETIYTTYQGQKWPSKKIATFVTDSWYSSQEISDTVIVNTGGGGGDCGLSFKEGETWLMYAYIHEGIVQSSICTGSINSSENSFASSIKYLEKLKLKTGHIKEKLEWYNRVYTLSGEIKKGKPIGQWLRLRGTDTLAILNFNSDGKRHGYQMKKNEDWDDTIVKYYETSDSYVKIYNSDKKLEIFYELRNGKRNGKYEKSLNNIRLVNANYKNGRLVGEWTSWHVDAALAKGKIRTEKIFDNDCLKSSLRFEEETGRKIDDFQ